MISAYLQDSPFRFYMLDHRSSPDWLEPREVVCRTEYSSPPQYTMSWAGEAWVKTGSRGYRKGDRQPYCLVRMTWQLGK
jgi:hypothetical protein